MADQLNLQALREMLARAESCTHEREGRDEWWLPNCEIAALEACREATPALIARAEMAGKLLAVVEDAMCENYSHPDGPFLNDPQRAATVIAAARAAGIEPEP